MHRLISSSPALARLAVAAVAVAAGGAGTLAAATSSAAAAGNPACQTGGLVVWLDTSTNNGTAGGVAYIMRLTNISGHTCTLRGFPGLSAVSLRGRQLGKSASRDHVGPVRTITLKNGRSAAARFLLTFAANFPASRCQPTYAAGLRVFPPNQGASKTAPFPFTACASRSVSILSVQPVTSSRFTIS